MRSVLVPFDGSAASLSALRSVVQRARDGEVGSIHVTNVQPLFNRHIGQFVDSATMDDFRREESEAALSPARQILDTAGLRYRLHRAAGDEAVAIARIAAEAGVDEIVLSDREPGFLGSLLARILVRRVRRATGVPVTIVRERRSEVDMPRATGHLQSARI